MEGEEEQQSSLMDANPDGRVLGDGVLLHQKYFAPPLLISEVECQLAFLFIFDHPFSLLHFSLCIGLTCPW